MADEKTEPSKRLVLVVHGIGEQVPGETLDRFVGGITGNRAGNVQSEKRLLRDEHADVDPRAIDLFDCEIRKVDTDQSKLVFAEVFWADLSRGPSGQLATLIEFIMLVLGLGHLVRENAEELFPEQNRHWLRSLSNLLVATLHGPVAVLNLLLALGAASIYAANTFMPESPPIHTAVGATAVVGMLGGYFARKNTGSYLFAIFANWLFWLGISVAVLVAATVLFIPEVELASNLLGAWASNPPRVECAGSKECQIAWYALLLIAPLNLTWLLMLTGVLSIAIAQGLRDWRANEWADPKSLYSTILAIMTVFWLVIASTFWASLSAFMNKPPDERVFKQDLLQSGTNLIAITQSAIAVILVVAVIIWCRRVRWAKRHDTRNFDVAQQPPRLILNASLQRASSIAILLLFAVAILNLFSLLFKDSDNWPAGIFRCISEYYPVALAIGVGIGVFYLVIWSQLAVGVGIAKDIITYFKGEPSARNSIRPEYPLRSRINQRFVNVMDTMIASEKPDEVVVLAHSQGTVIAIEAMRDSGKSHLFDTKDVKKRMLITMGSPYGHVYEHYFTSKFPLPTDFDTRLDKWINIFRIDDFVGTFVGPPDGHWPRNVPVNSRGHTGYWTDSEVLDVLMPEVFPELT